MENIPPRVERHYCAAANCTVPSSQMGCMLTEVAESFHERCTNALSSPTSAISTATQPSLKQLVEYCMSLASTAKVISFDLELQQGTEL